MFVHSHILSGNEKDRSDVDAVCLLVLRQGSIESGARDSWEISAISPESDRIPRFKTYAR
jgi:hypothetical protein